MLKDLYLLCINKVARKCVKCPELLIPSEHILKKKMASELVRAIHKQVYYEHFKFSLIEYLLYILLETIVDKTSK